VFVINDWVFLVYFVHNVTCAIGRIKLKLRNISHSVRLDHNSQFLLSSYVLHFCVIHCDVLFTQPPAARGRMRICFTDVFLVFFRSPQNTRQPFSGTAEGIFMQLLPNDSGENVVCIAVPKWGLGPRLIFWRLKTTHCALGGDAWRVTEN